MLARPIFRASRLCCRFYATDTKTVPPLLLRIRNDLKTAMRNKDTVRLRVIRSILAQTKTQSEKNAINTDQQVLKILKKASSSNKDAAAEFTKGGRADLAEKESQEAAVMDEYVASVPEMGEGDLKGVYEKIEAVLGQMEKDAGEGWSRETVKVGDAVKKVFEGTEGQELEKKFGRGEVVKILMGVLKKPKA
ncbi:hypothetical protein VTL71DRAFT_7215 [Oculimacula yallundae]|uniref:Altered inheritance of mitochondria protein 41 n=1 Tax=Oculimacula yallundae TaxID=86028 RepID=A0ABR4BW25_9HELO